MQGGWACPFHLPASVTGGDPGRSECPVTGLGALLCHQTSLPRFRRAWAALRHDERHEGIKKKVHRLWCEEGLQVRVHSPRKRAGVSSVPVVEADAPKVVWALDFQFDSTIDGKAIKIASMVDEHTREALLSSARRQSPRRTDH